MDDIWHTLITVLCSPFLLYVYPVLVGGIVTWIVARCYYVKASKELREEAAELARLSNLALTGLEEGKIIQLKRGEGGKIIGINITLGVSGIHSGEAIGNPSVTQSPPK